jgi:hypothetical protein
MFFFKNYHYKLEAIIFFFLFFIILNKFDFFFNIYNIFNNNHELRMIKKHGYCNINSYGFLTMLKKKYNPDKNFKVINYKILPSQKWIYYDPKKTSAEKPNVFLNYEKKLQIFFSKKNNFFESKNLIQHSNNIESINFELKSPSKMKSKIKIFKIKDRKSILIYSGYISNNLNLKETIKINKKTDQINSRWEKILIKIDNEKLFKKISKINIMLTNKYLFNKKDILEQYDNCYFVK